MRFCFMTLLSIALSLSARAESQPQARIVSLAPNLTELLVAMDLGSLLVGRSSACDYPSHITLHPVVGGFGRPNWEALLAVRPTLVIASALEKPGLLKQLEQQGIRTLLLPCESWNDMKKAAMAMAEAAGQPEAGIKWCEGLRIRLSNVDERVTKFWAGRERPRVYAEIWNNPLTTAGRDTFLNDLIERAGGRNMGASLSAQYPSISPEWILTENPDVILLAYMMPGAGTVESLSKRIGWSTLDAVRKDRVLAHIHPDLLLRPGPRLVDGLEQITDYLIQQYEYAPVQP
jgi:iron complex transport system substrate-binding protein